MSDIPGDEILSAAESLLAAGARLLGGRQTRANARAQAMGFRNDYALRQARRTATGRRQVAAGERRLRTALGGRSTRGRSVAEIQEAGRRAEAARAQRSARARGVTYERPGRRGVRTGSQRTATARLREAAREGRRVAIKVTFRSVRRYHGRPSTGPTEITLLAHGGESASALFNQASATGGLFPALEQIAERSTGIEGARGVDRVEMEFYDE